MEITSLSDTAPRVLAHVRGRLDRDQAAFWVQLRHALRARGLELMLTAHCWPDAGVDVPVLRAPNGFSEAPVWAPDRGWHAWRAPAPQLPPAPYLAREALWNGPADDRPTRAGRETAAAFFEQFYGAALREARPVMTLIWNGHHPQELILRDLCRAAGCPVHYIERAPLHGAIQVDAEGVLADTGIARSTEWRWTTVEEQARGLAVAARATAACLAAGRTWWDQPESQDAARLRQRLGIRPGQQVLLFAGQVDRDAQNLLFAPHFGGCREALAWFCAQLPKDGSVFLLGKHHPMSPDSPARYAEVVGSLGKWTCEVALDDALAVADRVAAVNSTVLFEALMRGKPVYMLGDSLLSHKGIAYEFTGPGDDAHTLRAWLAAEDLDGRLGRWKDYWAWLITHAFYRVLPETTPSGQRGAEELADYVQAHAVAPEQTHYAALPSVPPFLDTIALWLDAEARGQRHTGFKEALRGLNIAAEATLGRRMPGVYNALLRFANTLYNRSTAQKP